MIFYRLNAVAASLLLICTGCTLGNQATSIPLPTVTLATSVPNLTYTNTAYGYSIDYPAAVTLEGDADDQFVWLDRQIEVMVSNVNPEDARGDAPVIETAEDTTVAGFNARRLNGYVGAVGGGTPQRYESIVIPHNNSYYVFTVYELKNDVVLPVDREFGDIPPEALTLFEQAVSSVRFSE
jgi:hypothetical protein